MVKSTKDVLYILKAYKPNAVAKYGITILGLFGSCARGQQHEGSDIDICFDGKTPSLFTMARMENELEELMGCPVQLTMLHDDMPENLKNNIKRDAIYV